MMKMVVVWLLFMFALLALPTQGLSAPAVIMPQTSKLRRQLQDALAKKGVAYKPHTRYLLPDGRPKYTNRLILESSPYLLQQYIGKDPEKIKSQP